MSACAAVWQRLPVGPRLALITACSINVALVKDNAVASNAPSTICPRPDLPRLANQRFLAQCYKNVAERIRLPKTVLLRPLLIASNRTYSHADRRPLIILHLPKPSRHSDLSQQGEGWSGSRVQAAP